MGERNVLMKHLYSWCSAFDPYPSFNGYQNVRYRVQRCEGYPLHSGCLKANGNRTIEVNHRLLEYKRKAREKLTAEEGLEHRSNVP
jgi:hypothetical protein